MELTRENIDYRTLAGAVIPRPIAWTSSLSAEGEPNLAPFSFFNVATTTPPILMVSITKYDGDKPDRFKDTYRNILDTKEFVVNVVTRPLLESMNESSARLPRGESEFNHADIETEASTLVEPERVAASKVSFECTLYDVVPVGKSALIFGDVVHAHVDDSVTTDGKLDVTKLDAVGRLSGGYYATLDNLENLERPP